MSTSTAAVRVSRASSPWKVYAKNILVTVILGAAVGLLSRGDASFEALEKPPLAPPAILFPIVWTILYILMGISYSRVELVNRDDNGTKLLYWLQLIVNLLWPIAFFVLGWRVFALIWLVLLDVLVIVMTVRFYQKEHIAGLLQIPYLVWVLFATYLNLGFVVLNG